MHMHGFVKGKQIVLDRETGLPDGVSVFIKIETEPRTSVAERRRLVDSLCGVWANDKNLKTVFAEIERVRATAAPREVSFDVAS